MRKTVAGLSAEIKQYLIVTGNYWAFTLTDGALRMLVVLHFHQLGYSPLSIAALFLFYGGLERFRQILHNSSLSLTP